MLLKASDGLQAVAHEVRKRITAFACSGSFVDHPQTRDLVRDLNQQRTFITNTIAPADPELALDLMWRFLDLAEPTVERCIANSMTPL